MAYKICIDIEAGSPNELAVLFALIRGDYEQVKQLRKEINELTKDTTVLQNAINANEENK